MTRVKELSENELKILKSKELMMLQCIDEVCREQDIKYSLAAGTLLGAVRHQGFIPWDDDIDIMILRDDYERFLRCCEEYLFEYFSLVEYKNTKGYGMPFAKLMLKKSVMIEKNTSKINIPHGIFIDIFPIDKAPTMDYERRKLFNRVKKIKKDLLCRSGYFWDEGVVFDVLYRIRGMILGLIPKCYYVHKIDQVISISNNSSDYCYVSYTGDASLEKASYKKEWFDEYVELPFEGYTFKAIKGYREYLSTLYGCYTELPPKELQIPHHSVVEFIVD